MYKLYKSHINKNIQMITFNQFLIDNNIRYLALSSKLNKYNKLKQSFNLQNYNNKLHYNNNIIVFGLYNKNDFNKLNNHNGKLFIIFGGKDCVSLNNTNLKKVISLINTRHKNVKFVSINKYIYDKLVSVGVKSTYTYLDFFDTNVFNNRKQLTNEFIKNNYNDYLISVQKRYTNNNLINDVIDTTQHISKKIVCVTCAYKREELLNYVINHLSSLGELLKIIVVGSNNTEKEIVEKYELCEYHNYENLPLSNKWNKGVLEARKHNPDAILIMGSDDIVSKEYLNYGKYLLSKNYDFIGCRSWFTLLKDGDTVIDNALVGYRNNRRGNEPIGAGRIISKKILDKLDWNLYKFHTPINKSLDFNSYKKVLNIKDKLNFKIIHPTNTIYMAGIKDVKYEHISVTHGSSANKDIPGSSWYKWQKESFSNPLCQSYTDYFTQEVNNVKHLENVGIVV